VILITANNEALPFYSELLSGSFVEGNLYSFTFENKFQGGETYTIDLTCDTSNGYVTKFAGDLSPIVGKKNLDISIDGNETLETLRVEWSV
jgi:hypothetical protein